MDGRRDGRRTREGVEGWTDGWILIYYCLPPAGGRIRSQGNKMRRLRRRTREGVEEWIGWLSRFDLIRLRRISLATLRMDGRRDGRRDCKRYVQ
jgi:hypothetical protein